MRWTTLVAMILGAALLGACAPATSDDGRSGERRQREEPYRN